MWSSSPGKSFIAIDCVLMAWLAFIPRASILCLPGCSRECLTPTAHPRRQSRVASTLQGIRLENKNGYFGSLEICMQAICSMMHSAIQRNWGNIQLGPAWPWAEALRGEKIDTAPHLVSRGQFCALSHHCFLGARHCPSPRSGAVPPWVLPQPPPAHLHARPPAAEPPPNPAGAPQGCASAHAKAGNCR